MKPKEKNAEEIKQEELNQEFDYLMKQFLQYAGRNALPNDYEITEEFTGNDF